jgi:hypothetical protein
MIVDKDLCALLVTLSDVSITEGDSKAAISYAEQALEGAVSLIDNFMAFDCIERLCKLSADVGKYKECKEYFEKGRIIIATEVSRNPIDNDLYLRQLLLINRIVKAHYEFGFIEDATNRNRDAFRIMEVLPSYLRNLPEYKYQFCLYYHNTILINIQLNAYGNAQEASKHHLKTASQLYDRDTSNAQYRKVLINAISAIALVSYNSRNVSEAKTHFDEYAQASLKFTYEFENHIEFRYNLGVAKVYLAKIDMLAGDNTGAKDLLREADLLFQSCIQVTPDNLNYKYALCSTKILFALLFKRDCLRDLAHSYWNEAAFLLNQLIVDFPGMDKYKVYYGISKMAFQ